jgi:uncharacterized protein with gpF-like domain
LTAALEPEDRAAVILYKIGLERKAGKAFTPEQLDREWRAVDRMKRAVERDVEGGISEAFEQIERGIMARLRELGDMKAELQVAQIFKYDEALAEIEPAIRAAVLAALSEGLNRGQARLGISSAQRVRELTPDVVEEMIRRSKFVNVIQTTEDQISKAIAQVESGLDNETMIQRITDQVRQTFEGIRANRIPAIVNTTVNSAFESGQHEAFRLSAVEQKQWLSQRDGRVRESHDLVDGQQVAINQSFDVMGVPLSFPGDPAGPPEEIINCRCTMIPVT